MRLNPCPFCGYAATGKEGPRHMSREVREEGLEPAAAPLFGELDAPKAVRFTHFCEEGVTITVQRKSYKSIQDHWNGKVLA